MALLFECALDYDAGLDRNLGINGIGRGALNRKAQVVLRITSKRN
jgi:hypothetical protein